MLPSLKLEKPFWQTGFEKREFEQALPKKLVYRSHEIQRVMAMGIPAAVIVKLPRMASPGVYPLQASTDILLYFIRSGEVSVFDLTVNDVRRTNKGCDIKFYGTYDAFPEEDKPRKFTFNRFDYSVELSPFLIIHSSPAPDESRGSFMINCEAHAGVTGVEVIVDYFNDKRESEAVELHFYHGGNESTLEFQQIARWVPNRDKEKRLLTWSSESGSPFLSQLYHVRGYHEEPENE